MIVTQDPDFPVIMEKKDSAILLEELPRDLDVRLIGNPLFSTSIFAKLLKQIFRDSSLPWGIKVFLIGNKLARIQSFDMIVTVGPPFGILVIGWLISKIQHLPFVIDMKDDWVGSSGYLNKNKWLQRFTSLVEKFVMKGAKIVSFVTAESHEVYKKRYEYAELKTDFILAPNGVDLEEYTVLGNKKRVMDPERFVILTAASGYRTDYRDLSPLFKGVEDFLQRNPSVKGKVDLVFLGNEVGNEYANSLKDIASKIVVSILPVVPRKEFVEWLWKADLLFLVQPKGNFTSISGTLYEYWATGKAPILLISESGASSVLINKHKLGEHYHFHDIGGISSFIERTYTAHKSQKPVWIEREGIEMYDRKVVIRKLLEQWSNLH